MLTYSMLFFSVFALRSAKREIWEGSRSDGLGQIQKKEIEY